MTLDSKFLEQMERLLGSDEATRLCSAITGEPASIAVRMNEGKGARADDVCGAKQVPWCREGVYLDHRPQFTFDIDFQAGRYYVQDASSMFVSHVARSLCRSAVRCLDLCAAPGGKTTALLGALPEGSVVAACEIMPARAAALMQNVVKWGDPRCAVMCGPPQAMASLEECFDVVCVDAPCSGEGMFRKDDEAVQQWSPKLVEQCAARQRNIVEHAWRTLRKGGLLIYSTCTYNREENEAIVDYIAAALGGESVKVPLNAEWNVRQGIDTQHHVYRFMPHLVNGEGLTMAVMRKSGSGTARSAKKTKRLPAVKLDGAIRGWITQSDVSFTEHNGQIIAARPEHKELNALLGSVKGAAMLKPAGLAMATVKGRKFVPTQDLAFSQWLNTNAFPQAQVDYPTALECLRAHALPPLDAPQGITLVNYRSTPLAFANNLQARANNLFPKQWRIISPHNPDKEPKLFEE